MSNITQINPTDYRSKVMGCWLGKAVGGTLGMPYEGREGPFGLDFYRPVPEAMMPNDDLDLSSEITGISPPASLDAFTGLVINLRERLGAQMPIRAEASTLPRDMSIPVRIGSTDTPWFGHGWQSGLALELTLPQMSPTSMPGTAATLDTTSFKHEAIFVEYRFRIDQSVRARVMFNTHEPCRVFLDSNYAFGRDTGRMAPSPHRVPYHQFIDVELPAGEHTLVAVLRNPEHRHTIQWVIGLSDCDNNDQWMPVTWLKSI